MFCRPAATPFTVDVSDADQCAAMVAAAVDTFGRLDVAVNSAGIANIYPAEELTEAAWDAVVDIDLKGIFLSEGGIVQ